MKNSTLKLIIIIIIIIFTSAYYMSNSGYYEYALQEKTILTNEKIKEFEQDVAQNQDIDIKTYLETEEEDYSNKITNLMYNISNGGNKLARKFMKALFKKISAFVDE